ncbi:MAG: hypothetical protein Q8L87_09080 [Anaerolineales bacterium]|jgi:uncharacterized cupredoxin-like copper-binding protein|nr:hypothetical protein [Anaerolineales bacterium]
MFIFKRLFIMLSAVGMLLTACSGQGTVAPVEVTITLTEFGIEPSLTEFKTGVPYHFVVTNEGAVEHEIMIMPPLTEDDMGMAMDMEELDELALVMIEASDLPVGGTASFDYTFTEAAPAGALEFACHTPGHYEAGMKLPITVSP